MSARVVQLRHVMQCLDSKRVPLNREQRSSRSGSVPYWGAGGVVDRIDAYLFDEPLVLLGEDGAPFFDPLKPVAFYVTGPTWVNNHIHVLRPRGGVEPRFLAYALNSVDYGLYITGSTRDKLTQDDMRGIQVVLPSLEEQRRIADFLDGQVGLLDRAISLRQEQRDLAVEKEHAALGQLVDGAFTHGSLPLKRLSRGIEQGSSPQCDAVPADGDEWGVLKLSAVKRGRFNAEENKRIPDGVAPVEAYEVKDGDLLVTRANTPQLVGDVAVARDVPPHRQLCDLIYRVRLDDDVVPEFIASTLVSPRLRALIPAIARGSSASMIKLRGEDILGLPIPALTSAQQHRLVADHRVMSERNDRLLRLLDQSLSLLAERKHALIAAAVTGDFDVTTARGAA